MSIFEQYRQNCMEQYYNKIKSEAYEQGRAEAIEDFRRELELLPLDDRELVKYAIADEHSFNEYVDWVAEELKGQNK